MRRSNRLLGGAILLASGLYLNNASLFSSSSGIDPKLLSHRGVHQTFHREGLTNETCTAERIYQPTHEFLENTLPSIQAAFDFGADMVEIDIHATTDGEFAVFHDWTLDCRTNGSGRTIDHSMDELRALDLGFGYTADDGSSFPLRGKGVGLMPTLGEVLEAFPDRAFMINAKSNNPQDAALLLDYLLLQPGFEPRRHAVVAGPRWVEQWRQLGGEIPATFRRESKTCAQEYISWGWSGYLPKACSEFGVGVPLDFRRLYWGWPHRLEQRFDDTPMGVLVTGKLRTVGGGTGGIDSLEDLQELPEGYSGWINTNRIELIGPAVHDTQEKS